MPIEIIIPGLIILGFILILIEIFLVPGVNIFGIFGFAMVVIGIILAYSKLDSTVANFIMIGSVLLSVILVRLVVKSKSWKRMVLDTKQKSAEGFHAAADNLHELAGQKGITHTKLRPAGMAMINEQKIDVVAEGSFIDQNKKIEVILVEGNRVVVREIKNDDLQTN